MDVHVWSKENKFKTVTISYDDRALSLCELRAALMLLVRDINKVLKEKDK